MLVLSELDHPQISPVQQVKQLGDTIDQGQDEADDGTSTPEGCLVSLDASLYWEREWLTKEVEGPQEALRFLLALLKDV